MPVAVVLKQTPRRKILRKRNPILLTCATFPLDNVVVIKIKLIFRLIDYLINTIIIISYEFENNKFTNEVKIVEHFRIKFLQVEEN